MCGRELFFLKTFDDNSTYIIMKKEEQTVHPKTKLTGKSAKQPPNMQEAEQRATESPGKEASVAAELKNREK
jgi:hypothetical protein